MSNEHTKLKRALGFSASYGAAVGLVVSGTAMFSVSSLRRTRDVYFRRHWYDSHDGGRLCFW